MFFEGAKNPRKKSLNFSVKCGTVFLKKIGSDLVVQSSRQGYPEQNFALYHLGMVPGVWVFKGVGRGWIFMFFEGHKSANKNNLNFSKKKVLGGQIWKRIFEKTRVGFGRTELSIRLS